MRTLLKALFSGSLLKLIARWLGSKPNGGDYLRKGAQW